MIGNVRIQQIQLLLFSFQTDCDCFWGIFWSNIFLSNICFNFLIFCVVSGGKRLQKRYSSHKLWQNFGGRTPIFHQSQEWVCTFVRNMTSLIHAWYRGAHCSCVKKETIFPIGQKLSGQYFSQLPNYSQTFPNIINKTLILGGAEMMWWWILLDPKNMRFNRSTFFPERSILFCWISKPFEALIKWWW